MRKAGTIEKFRCGLKSLLLNVDAGQGRRAHRAERGKHNATADADFQGRMAIAGELAMVAKDTYEGGGIFARDEM
jgi:hypothetical protein